MKQSTSLRWTLALFALIAVALISVVVLQGSQVRTSAAVVFSADPVEIVNEPIQPIPLTLELDVNKVKLGRRLFHEPMLSANNAISCASCHDLSKGGIDHLQYAKGIDDAVGNINTPTVYNSGLSFRQFWNGRAATLNIQVGGPVTNPIEMGSTWDQALGKLKSSPEYPALFSALYSDGITSDNVADAIATFERSLTTPNSRFDQFLRGNRGALSADELKGYALFKAYGCVTCHQGANVGGNMYQRMGIVVDYFAERGNITDADFGLFNVTGKAQDKFVFKVPSLRLVALTPPYFHDGSLKTLEDAVKAMAYYQLGRSISPEEISYIVQFLKTLPGDNVELTAKP